MKRYATGVSLNSTRQIHLQAAFRSKLRRWYVSNARDLPWRRSSDPYRIWISEIMLQQTRVDQATPYFDRFVALFPTVRHLADADLDQVLGLWEGLGYYARARNLHAAARVVMQDLGGRFPDTIEGLRALPGIGAYTAAAVGSIAYGIVTAAIDGNVTRVVSRVFLVTENVKSTIARRKVEEIAGRLVDPVDPGSFNQAMMELGATVCLPKIPRCDVCPVFALCQGAASGNPAALPTTSRAKPIPHRDIAVGIVRDDLSRVLVIQRAVDSLLGGLWEFPGGQCREGETLELACRRGILNKIGLGVEPVEKLATLKHQFSHFKITMHVFSCISLTSGRATVTRMASTCRWVSEQELASLPMHRTARRTADLLMEANSPLAR